MRTIYFGLQLDQANFSKALQLGDVVVGPIGLLKLFEQHFGIAGYLDDIEYLRIETYRNSLKRALQKDNNLFFSQSFIINEFAVAKSLLKYRDELQWSGWDFKLDNDLPIRLKDFAFVESFVADSMPIGYTERYLKLLDLMSSNDLSYNRIILNEPLHLLPFFYQRFFTVLNEKGVEIKEKIFPVSGKPSFEALRNNLIGNDFQKAENQGSVILIQTDSEQTGAEWLSKWLATNEKQKPLILVSDHKRLLDIALQQEGLPSLGISTVTKSRPSLQLLKLATVLLQKPLDSDRLISFLLLPLQPLPHDIAYKIAENISNSPGYNLDVWRKILHQNAGNDDVRKLESLFRQIFERPKFSRNERIPESEILSLYTFLDKWLFKYNDVKHSFSIRLIREYLLQLIELFQTMQEADFTFTTLHQIINAVIDPTNIQIDEEELGSYPVIFQPSQMIHNHQFVIWWNFVDFETSTNIDFWTKPEKEFFTKKSIVLSDAQRENQTKFYQNIQPFFLVDSNILLIIPATIDGDATLEHPLLPYLKATFDNLVIHIIDSSSDNISIDFGKVLSQYLIKSKTQNAFLPFIELNNYQYNFKRELESPSSLDKLLYYPHQWFFEYILQFRNANVLTTNDIFTIKGNIIHRIIEHYYMSNPKPIDIKSWFLEQFNNELARQGAALLSYGSEPEKRSFELLAFNGFQTLVRVLIENHWEVIHNEHPVKGQINEEQIGGIIDLVAKRGDDILIIDIKFSGYTKRYNLLKNNEDLQLFWYKKLYNSSEIGTIYTAYFIVDAAKFITKYPNILKDANVITFKSELSEIEQIQEQSIFNTLDWRQSQMKNGFVELRIEETINLLEDLYANENQLDRIEMKSNTDKYDCFCNLIKHQ